MRSDLLARRVIRLTSTESGAGKTTLGLAFARWFREEGVSVAPVHRSRGGTWDLVQCPENGEVSWPAALLAQACDIHPEPAFEAGEGAEDELLRRFDVLVIEEQAGGNGTCVERGGGRLLFSLEQNRISLLEHEPLPALEPESEILRALPRWRQHGQPRCAIVSLPHLCGFEDWRNARGAEWLTSPGIGDFNFVFVPFTQNREHDLEWMRDRGLVSWVEQQRTAGCRVVSCGWSMDRAERVEPETIQDDRAFSLLTGFRCPARMLEERELESLSSWLERGVGRESLLKLLP